MVNSQEVDNLKHEVLGPEVCRRSKCDTQVDLPYRGGLHASDHAMERQAAGSKASPIDAHAVEGLGVKNVEAAAFVDQDPSESSLLDDGVDHQRNRPGYGTCVGRSLRLKVIDAYDHRKNLGVTGSTAKTSRFAIFEVCLPPRASGTGMIMRQFFWFRNAPPGSPSLSPCSASSG